MEQSTLTISTGQKRINKIQTAYTNVVYITPTGLETPLSNSPLVKMSRKSYTDTLSINKEVVTIYKVQIPVGIKLVSTVTEGGRTIKRINMYIKINPTDELFEIKGYNECGCINGRGQILFEASGITKKVAETDFSYRVVGRAITAIKNGKSNLILG